MSDTPTWEETTALPQWEDTAPAPEGPRWEDTKPLVPALTAEQLGAYQRAQPSSAPNLPFSPDPGTELTAQLPELAKLPGKALGTVKNIVQNQWAKQGFLLTGQPQEAAAQDAALAHNEAVRWGLTQGPTVTTPYEEGMAALPTGARIAANIPYQMAGMAPKLALLALAPETLPAQMAGSGALFGVDDDGNFNVKEAGLMALLPGVSAVGRAATGKAIAAGIEAGVGSLENATVQQALTVGGDQLVMNGYMLAMDNQELRELSKTNPTAFWESVGNIVGQNLAFGMLHLKQRGEDAHTQFLNDIAKDKALLATFPEGFVPKENKVSSRPTPPVIDRVAPEQKSDQLLTAEQLDQAIENRIAELDEKVNGKIQFGPDGKPERIANIYSAKDKAELEQLLKLRDAGDTQAIAQMYGVSIVKDAAPVTREESIFNRDLDLSDLTRQRNKLVLSGVALNDPRIIRLDALIQQHLDENVALASQELRSQLSPTATVSNDTKRPATPVPPATDEAQAAAAPEAELKAPALSLPSEATYPDGTVDPVQTEINRLRLENAATKNVPAENAPNPSSALPSTPEQSFADNAPATKADLKALADFMKNGGNNPFDKSPAASPAVPAIPRAPRKRMRVSGREGEPPNVLDAVSETGGLGGPDLEAAMKQMAAGKTAAQVLEPYGAEYDALADVLESIFEARRGQKNNGVANDLAKAYRVAGFGGNTRGVDLTLQNIHSARDQGLGLMGGTPETEAELIGQAWQAAQDKVTNPNQLPTTPEGKADLFWQTATAPDSKIGLKRVNIDELKIGDRFRLKGKGLSHAELTVRFIDPDTGEVQVKDGPTFGTQDLPPGTEIYVHDLQPAPDVKFAAGERLGTGQTQRPSAQSLRETPDDIQGRQPDLSAARREQLGGREPFPNLEVFGEYAPDAARALQQARARAQAFTDQELIRARDLAEQQVLNTTHERGNSKHPRPQAIALVERDAYQAEFDRRQQAHQAKYEAMLRNPEWYNLQLRSDRNPYSLTGEERAKLRAFWKESPRFAAGDFAFDQPESVADQKARQAAEKRQTDEAKAKAAMQDRAQQRLTSDEDTRTVDMFGGQEHATTRQNKSGQGSLFAEGAGSGLSVSDATAAITKLLGVKELPAGIRVVRDESATWGAKIEGRDTITVNAAQISSPERARQVILEEGLHGVWNDPQVQRAWERVRQSVTAADLEAEFAKRKAQGLDTRPETIREEAAIARLIEGDANKGMLAKLYDAIRQAFKRVFGFDLPATDRQALKDAALTFLRNRAGWYGAKGEFEPPKSGHIGQLDLDRMPGQQRLFSAGEELAAEKFRNQFLRWRLGDLQPQEWLILGRTPEALRAAGIPDGELYISQEVLNKKPTDPNHPYPATKLARLPEALNDPILVHESWTEPNAYVALLDLEHGGKNMVAALHFRTTAKGLEVTEISSVYPRDAKQVVEAINRTGGAGGVTYYHKEKVRQWLAKQSGFNSPHGLGLLLGQKNIPTNHDLGQGRFAVGDTPPTDRPERERSAEEVKAELASTETRLKELIRQAGDPALRGGKTKKELQQERNKEVAKLRGLREELLHHPEYVAEQLLRQQEATTQANAMLKPFGKTVHPEDLPDLTEAHDKLSPEEFMQLSNQINELQATHEQLQKMPPKLVDRIMGELQAKGLLPQPRHRDPALGRSLDQVTDWLRSRGVDSPKMTLAERLNLGARWSENVQAAKSTLAKARQTMEGVWKAAVESYKRPPLDDDFRRVIKSWIYADQRTGLATHQFVKELIAKVPKSERRRAIAIWLDANGDTTVLQAQLADVPDAYKSIWKAALNLTADERALALQLKRDFATKLDDALAANLIQRGREDYGVPQRWKIAPQVERDPTEATRPGSAGRINAKLDPRDPFFALARQTPTYFDGIMAKGVPENLDIAHLVTVYDAAFHKALSSRGMVAALQNAKAKDGLPVVRISGSANVSRDGGKTYFVDSNTWTQADTSADGRPYQSLDHFALKGWKIAAKDAEGNPILVRGDMLIHPDHYAYLKNELGQSRLREGAFGAVLNPVFKSQAFLKASKLSGSAFHLMTIGEHMASHLVNPFLNGFKLDLRDPTQSLLVRNGLALGMDYPQRAYEEGLAAGHGGVFNMVPGLGDLSAKLTDWMFKDYIPAIMMKAGLHAFENNLKRYGDKLSRDEVAELTAQQMNAAGGLLNYRMRGSEGNMWGRLGADKTWLDFQRLFLMAPQFLEARARVVGQALKPYGHEQRKMLILQAGILYVGARVLNQLLDGDPHWTDNPFSVVYKGRAYSIRTIVGDTWHMLSDPKSFAAGRLSPIARIGIEGVTGRDLRTGARKEPPIPTNNEFSRTAQNAIVDMAKWLIPIPIEGVATSTATTEQTAASFALQSVGIGSRKFTANMQMHDLATTFNRNHPDAAVREAQRRKEAGAYPESAYRKLDALLDSDQIDAAAREVRALQAEGKPLPQIVARYSRTTYFTGSAEREKQFYQTLTEGQKQIYQRAKAERQHRGEVLAKALELNETTR